MSGTTGATYPRGTMAKLLLMTERSVDRLATDGVLVRTERGRFDLVGSIQGYVKFLRDRSLGGGSGDEVLASAKGRMIKARARMAEAEADMLDNTLLPRAAVEAAWDRVLTAVRLRLLALPSKAAPPMHGAATIAEASAILTAAVHDALAELARTPVYAAAAERPSGIARGSANGADPPRAPADADDIRMG